MKKIIRTALICLTLLFAIGMMAQQHEAAPQEPAKASTQATNPNQVTDRDLAKASEHAENPETTNPDKEEEEEYVALKQSPSVRWVARALNVTPLKAYWLLIGVNFLILGGAIVMMTRKSVPLMMRNRTADIQKGIEEARKASAEATARLSDIEARLSKLDGEVAALTSAAEADFTAEEKRIKEQAEADAKHVVEAAQQEIEAAARSAQRELKVFAADLAVSLAEKKIKVDPKVDEELVRGFVTQLGKDGK